MPYIEQPNREWLETYIADLPVGELGHGDLNYLLTRILIRWTKENGLNYARIKDVLGTLDAVGKEFYRKVGIPYEDQKCRDNGEVYFL